MATPITWQNINGPSAADASRPLDSAARAFDMGFGALNRVLDQRNTIADQNFQTGVKNNTNTEMNRLMGIDSIDAFKAAKSTLGQTLDGYGATIDQDKLRQFADQRVGVLQQREKQTIEFDNMLKDERSMPFMQAFKTASLREDEAGMRAAEEAYIKAGGRHLPDLVAYNDNRLNQMTERERAADKHKWEKMDLDSNILYRKNQSAIGFQNASTAARNATVNEAEAMGRQHDRLLKHLDDLRERKAKLMDNPITSKEGLAALKDALALLPSDKDREVAMDSIAAAQKKNPGLTLNAALAGALGARDGLIFSNKGDTVRTMLNSGPTPEQVTARQGMRDEVQQSMDSIRQQINTLGVVPMGSKAGRGVATRAGASGSTGVSIGMPAAPTTIPGAVNGAVADTPELAQMGAMTPEAKDAHIQSVLRQQFAAQATGAATQGQPTFEQAPATASMFRERLERERAGALAEVAKQYPGSKTHSKEAREARNQIARAYSAENEVVKQAEMEEGQADWSAWVKRGAAEMRGAPARRRAAEERDRTNRIAELKSVIANAPKRPNIEQDWVLSRARDELKQLEKQK